MLNLSGNSNFEFNTDVLKLIRDNNHIAYMDNKNEDLIMDVFLNLNFL